MKTLLIYNIIRWLAYVIGGLVGSFFIFMFASSIVGGVQEGTLIRSYTAFETSFFVFLGVTLVGLIVSYFRLFLGGCMALGGSLAIIVSLTIRDGGGWSLSDGGAYYLLLLPGILYVIAGSLRKQIKSKE